MLDGLNDWAKNCAGKGTLDDHLWQCLGEFATTRHSMYPVAHVQALFNDFRNRRGQRVKRRQRQCGGVLEASLWYLSNTYFEWRNGSPLIRSDQALQVQKWFAECNPDSLQCYLWAIDYAPEGLTVRTEDRSITRLRNLSPQVLKVLLHGPILPGVENPALEQLRQEGLAEIHRHLNGTILPSLLWSYLIQAPQRLSPRSLAGSLDGLTGHDCIALLRTARDLRKAIIGRLLNHSDAQTLQAQWNRDVLDRLGALYERLPIRFQDCPTFQVSGLPDYRDPAALLPLAEDKPLVAERAFLYHAFRLFHQNTDDSVLAAALHAYLLLQNLIWRALSQPRDTAKGFDRFDRYHGIFLRKPEKDRSFAAARERYLHRLIQAQRTGGIRWMELRTTPFDGVWQETYRLDRVLNRVLTKDISESRTNSEFSEAPFDAPGYHEYRLNQLLQGVHDKSIKAKLIFHFIKQADRTPTGGFIMPCRHSKLRCLVMKQAREIQQAHRSKRFGRYIVGLDAANAELNAGPEVFAPAIRWLREKTPCCPADTAYETLLQRFEPNEPHGYGLTYHVGEDFRHLLSGLRAVDEALRFLNMGAGDRIGHGLALGLDYTKWCLRMGSELAMPKGERLDDLAWLREKLSRDPGRFGRLLFTLDDKIRRLARDLYSKLQQEPPNPVDWQLLYEAWKYRSQDPLPYSNLEKLLRADLRVDTLPSQDIVWKLWHAYHFDPTVRKHYSELIKISLTDPRLEDWHEAITWVQDEMLREIVQKRIAIEINPTSNLCIGAIEDLTEHPVFRWHPPQASSTAIRPYIMVGSDDPGVFATELAFEYAALSRAAEERGATPREIAKWLRDLRDTSRAFCFIETV